MTSAWWFLLTSRLPPSPSMQRWMDLKRGGTSQGRDCGVPSVVTWTFARPQCWMCPRPISKSNTGQDARCGTTASGKRPRTSTRASWRAWSRRASSVTRPLEKMRLQRLCMPISWERPHARSDARCLLEKATWTSRNLKLQSCWSRWRRRTKSCWDSRLRSKNLRHPLQRRARMKLWLRSAKWWLRRSGKTVGSHSRPKTQAEELEKKLGDVMRRQMTWNRVKMLGRQARGGMCATLPGEEVEIRTGGTTSSKIWIGLA
mmetsp:Transcript_34835/g.75197  ORF Transcript_34835/g.75197 Transcript_34835/m.75197 type:complete len:259 (-) Transcript_34835:356-1132(-)